MDTHTHRVKMGVWDLIRTTAEAVKRNVPSVTPVTNACKNTYSYSAAAFTKIGEAAPTPMKNACRISYSYGSAAFTKIDQTVRINGLNKLRHWMRDDDSKSKVCAYTDRSSENPALEEGNKLIAVTKIREAVVAVVTPVKNACSTIYIYVSAAFTKIDQIVRINGLYRLLQWMEDEETKSRASEYTALLTKIVGYWVLQEVFRMIPGGDAFFIIAFQTAKDVNNVNTKPEEVKLLEEDAGSPHKDLSGCREIIVYQPIHGEGGVENVCRSSYASAAFTKISQTLNGLASWMVNDETKARFSVCATIFAGNACVYACQQSHKFVGGKGAFSRVLSRTLNEFSRKAKKH